MKDVEVVLKRSATLSFLVLDKVLMVTVEVDIGLRPSLLPPMIRFIVVYNQVLIVMVMI